MNTDNTLKLIKGLLNIIFAIKAKAVQILYIKFNLTKAVINRFTAYKVPKSLNSVMRIILSQL